ncbi:polyadenylate-binding protein-interacting protein 2B isoform X3 [Patagioenas fasciata]
MMNGPELGPSAPGPAAPDEQAATGRDDKENNPFAEYMWMENEEDFNRQMSECHPVSVLGKPGRDRNGTATTSRTEWPQHRERNGHSIENGHSIGNRMATALGTEWPQHWERNGHSIGNGMAAALGMEWLQHWEWNGCSIGNGTATASGMEWPWHREWPRHWEQNGHSIAPQHRERPQHQERLQRGSAALRTATASRTSAAWLCSIKNIRSMAPQHREHPQHGSTASRTSAAWLRSIENIRSMAPQRGPTQQCSQGAAAPPHGQGFQNRFSHALFAGRSVGQREPAGKPLGSSAPRRASPRANHKIRAWVSSFFAGSPYFAWRVVS